MTSETDNQRERGRGEVANLVAAFRTHAPSYLRASSDYNETQLRTDFLDPLLRALGWDVDNTHRLPQDLREVVQEATVEVSEEEQSKKPDYALRVGRGYKLFVEAKKPSVRVGEDPAPTFQARRYGFSASHPVTVLSNFDQTLIYRTIEPPTESASPREGVVARYTFEELHSKFDELYDTLSREAAYDGRFDKAFAADAPPSGYQQFDDYFLEQIESWRERLAGDIGRRNVTVTAHELNFFVQRILNRIIFLRICEDRHLERYESLRRLSSSATYDELKQLFQQADDRYNSGLFNLLEDPTLPLVIDNTILRSILEELYYPQSPYTFAVVDASVLGAIYDQFIAKQVEFAKGRSVILREKPEVRVSGGVFVTPRDIASEIVRRTLDPLANGKPAETLFELRVSDIACGSGVFLLSAFEYLQNRLIDAYLADGPDRHAGTHIYEVGAGQWRLTLAEKHNLLLRCLYGVDIDDQAVEVARFGLLLKTIEDESEASISAHLSRAGQKALPSLEENLKCGNSLVDSASFKAFLPSPTEDQWNRTNPFDWSDEFPGVMGSKGFSAIVGNPPYVRIQRLVQYAPEEAKFYQSEESRYVTAEHDNFDKYFLFIERALQLLRAGGRLGFIVPNKFMVLKSGGALRGLIAERRLLHELVHFGVHQVFLNSTTYTCLLFLERSAAKRFAFEHVRSLAAWRVGIEADRSEVETSTLSSEPWVFAPRAWNEVFTRLRDGAGSTLGEVADVFVGVQTSADKIYIVRPVKESGSVVTFKDREDRTWKIERGILRPCLYDAPIAPFSEPVPNAYIIFPYVSGDEARVIPSAQMREKFPLALAYLTAYKVKLASRNMQPGRADEWYRYGRSQGLTRFAEEKIILPTLAISPTYSLDKVGTLVTGGGNGPYYLVRPKPEPGWATEFILGVLSYPVLEAIVRAGSTAFRGGYYSRGKQFLAPLPMPTIDIASADGKASHDRIVRKVRELIALEARVRAARVPREKTTALRRKRGGIEELYAMLDQLFGVPVELRRDIEASFAVGGADEGEES